MAFDPNTLIYMSLIFFTIGTAIQIVAMLKDKSRKKANQNHIQSIMEDDESNNTSRRQNDPISFEKVDEHTIQKIDRIMKGGY